MASFCLPAAAQTLYAVSVRTYSDPSYRGVEGNLYRVDPISAATTLIAPLRLDGRDNIGLDGLAIHPKSGDFFGITPQTGSTIPSSLVRLDPSTGTVTLIGNLGAAGSDIAFDREGTLFAWLPAQGQLSRVDLKTGAATPIGTPRQATATKGAFQVTGGGTAMIAASGANGTLDTIDLKDGAIIASVPMSGARYPQLINGLAMSPQGILFGVNTNGGVPALADLVRIDAKTGQITIVGPLPNNTDALTFGPAVAAESHAWDLDRWRTLLLPVLILIAVGLFVIVARWLRH